MELKDIVLKKGDKIYTTDGQEIAVDGFSGNNAENIQLWYLISRITKIERPIKFETIYEAPTQILDDKEKKYLESVLRPFKNKIKYIRKEDMESDTYTYIKDDRLYKKEQRIWVEFIDDWLYFPNFNYNTMYKGMKVGKEYTLKELGLFEGDK